VRALHVRRLARHHERSALWPVRARRVLRVLAPGCVRVGARERDERGVRRVRLEAQRARKQPHLFRRRGVHASMHGQLRRRCRTYSTAFGQRDGRGFKWYGHEIAVSRQRHARRKDFRWQGRPRATKHAPVYVLCIWLDILVNAHDVLLLRAIVDDGRFVSAPSSQRGASEARRRALGRARRARQRVPVLLGARGERVRAPVRSHVLCRVHGAVHAAAKLRLVPVVPRRRHEHGSALRGAARRSSRQRLACMDALELDLHVWNIFKIARVRDAKF
jgi:hypothetical protein